MAITASVTRGYTFATGVEVTAAALNELGEPGVTVATPIAIASGGTNATSASAARKQVWIFTPKRVVTSWLIFQLTQRQAAMSS